MPTPLAGRGTQLNPPNRFERHWYDPAAEGSGEADAFPPGDDDERPSPASTFYSESPRSVLTHNDSPDIGFDTSINPYRGCEHGCIYCYARPTHEYLGWSAGLDFETKIVVKHDAPRLLRRELLARSWVPQVVSMSGVTDCYQPIESKLKLTRGCLEIFAEFLNPVGIVTKNHLVTRDIDLLQKLAQHRAVTVFISLTTLDPDLARRMEPRASTPARRLDAIRLLSGAGIPVGALMCPVVPGLNDTEIPDVVAAAAQAGASFAGYNIIALPYAVKELFDAWLLANYPLRYAKVISKIKQVRGGKLYDAEWSQRMSGQGPVAEQIAALFGIARQRAGLASRFAPLSTASFRRPTEGQLELF